MVGYAKKVAAQLSLTDKLIEMALGQALSEPMASVSFDPPDPVQTRGAFGRLRRLHGLHLDRRTQLLYLGDRFYANGELQPSTGLDRALLRGLSDRRQIPPQTPVDRATHDLLYRWYVYGWLHTGMQN
jgi:50S ribosomal protein L16 3-hydroxylase